MGDKILIYSPMNLVAEDEMFFPEEAVVGGVFQMGQRDFDGGYIISGAIQTYNEMKELVGQIRR